MKYLKVFTDFIEQIEPYSDAERGRLFTAMLEYARSSKEPAFKGNERFIWNSIKNSIDRDRETYDRMAGRARSVAENRAASSEKRHRNDIVRHRNDIVQKNNDIVQDKDKDKDKDYITPPTPSKGEERFSVFWKAYPRKVGKEAAKKAFLKLKVTDSQLEAMLAAIEAQKRCSQWRRDGGQYIPHPATWLNQGRWEDEGVVPFEPDPMEELPPPSFTTWESMYG